MQRGPLVIAASYLQAVAAAKSRARTAAVLVAGTALALVASCHGTEARKAMSYVETCTPGQPYEACLYALVPSRDVLPAGSLIGIELNIMPAVAAPTPAQPLHVVVRDSFDYSMLFGTRADCGTITSVLQGALGRPTHGRAPLLGTYPRDAVPAPDEIYWATEEGDWVCSSGSISWLSLPLDGFTPGTDDHLDRFVKPAPKSAALWRKVGQALIDH